MRRPCSPDRGCRVIVSKIRQTVHDAFVNVLTGMGTIQDRTTATRYRPRCHRIGESELTAIYRENWLAQRIVQALPNRAMARGVSDEGPWPDAYRAINFQQWDEGAFLRSCYFGRLYGGAGLYLGYENGGADLTLPPTPG